MTARRLIAGALAALTAALVAVTSCGVPLDDAPRALATTTTTKPLPSTSVAGSDDTGPSAFAFFISEDMLVSLSVDVPEATPTDVLSALFAGTPTGTNSEIVTQIPKGTRLLGTRQVGSTLVVDVSSEFDNLVGSGRAQATAQIVMTATDLAGIDQVALRIGGQPTQVFSPARGDADEVAACDYISLIPTEDVLARQAIDKRDRQHMTSRRNTLLTTCPPTSDR